MDDEQMGRIYASRVPVPPTPSDEMWEVIEGQLPGATGADDEALALHPRGASSSASRRGARDWTRTLAWPLAAGIALLVGIGLGRTSVGLPVADAPTDAPIATVASGPVDSDVSREAYQVLARQRVAGLEPLLTMLSADARSGQYDPQMADWADDQLTRTRLALDRPGADDPTIRALLEDLELILAQVANLDRYPRERAGQEMGLIAQALDDGDLLARVRAVRTVGP